MDEQRSAAWADPVHPVPRHDLYACELPIGGSLSTVAVPMRQMRQSRHIARGVFVAVVEAVGIHLKQHVITLRVPLKDTVPDPWNSAISSSRSEPVPLGG